MGSSSSKAANAGRAAASSARQSTAPRAAGRYDTQPSEFVAKQTQDPPMSPDAAAPRTDQAQAQQQAQQVFSEKKDDAIASDAADPNLDQNLRILGQVKVQRPASQFQPADQMMHIMQTRAKESAEEDEQDPTALAKRRNMLTSPLLAVLLDERKAVATRKEMVELAERFNVDISVLDRLGQHFNSPSVLERSKEDTKRDVMRNVWVDPPAEATRVT